MFPRPQNPSEWLATAILVAVCLTLCCAAEAAPACRVVNGVKTCPTPVITHQAPVVTHHAPVIQERVVEKIVEKPVIHERLVETVVETPVHQTHVANQNIWYGVGIPAAQQAMMTRAVRDAMNEYKFQAEVNGTITGSVSGGGGGSAAYSSGVSASPPAAPPRFSLTAPVVGSLVEQKCGQCHLGENAQGGFSMKAMDCDAQVASMKRVMDGTMPPSGPLPEAEKARVIQELIAQ